MSGVVKIEISESRSTLKKLLINARSAKEKEKIQTLYWLKTKTVPNTARLRRGLGLVRE